MRTCRAAALTHSGMIRPINEDAVLAGEKVFAVADGLGGHQAGEVASHRAIEALRRLDASPRIKPDDIVQCLHDTNSELLAHARHHTEAAGLGTTVAGLAQVSIADADHWAVFNVGDSRVYRFAGGQLARATVDHSEVEELMLRGELSEDDARSATNRHIITRSLGSDAPPVVDLWVMPLTEGDRFLICSDGLTGELDDAEIEAVLRSTADPERAVDQLLELALSSGGTDNISLILVVLDPPPGADGPNVTTIPRQGLTSAPA